MLASEERVGQGLRPGVVKGDESGLEDARGGCVPEPPHLPHDLRMRPGLLRVVIHCYLNRGPTFALRRSTLDFGLGGQRS